MLPYKSGLPQDGDDRPSKPKLRLSQKSINFCTFLPKIPPKQCKRQPRCFSFPTPVFTPGFFASPEPSLSALVASPSVASREARAGAFFPWPCSHFFKSRASSLAKGPPPGFLFSCELFLFRPSPIRTPHQLPFSISLLQAMGLFRIEFMPQVFRAEDPPLTPARFQRRLFLPAGGHSESFFSGGNFRFLSPLNVLQAVVMSAFFFRSPRAT